MNRKPAKQKSSDEAQKILFSVLLIAAAVGLFLISDAGRSLLAGTFGKAAVRATASFSPAATASAQPEETEVPWPLPEDIIAWSQENGGDGQYVLVKKNTYACEYEISRDDLPDAYIIFKLKDGRVYSFELVWIVALEPTPRPENSDGTERLFYLQDKDVYERDCAWLEEASLAMADALDAGDSLMQAELWELFSISQRTLDDLEKRAAINGDFACTVFVKQDQDGDALHVVFERKK
ncbi:MAG TPA: hypothetical protein VN540_08825 [Clostridia bacterium]|nr:hypothetical protein [Clostridia bacterium]